MFPNILFALENDIGNIALRQREVNMDVIYPYLRRSMMEIAPLNANTEASFFPLCPIMGEVICNNADFHPSSPKPPPPPSTMGFG